MFQYYRSTHLVSSLQQDRSYHKQMVQTIPHQKMMMMTTGMMMMMMVMTKMMTITKMNREKKRFENTQYWCWF